jgi:surface antigen
VSGDVTSGELPPTRAARRAADQAASRRPRRLDLAPVLRRIRRTTSAAVTGAGSHAASEASAGGAANASAHAPAPVTSPGRRHARVVATVLVVPAIVGTVALPAYASVQATAGFGVSDQFSQTLAEAQNVDVSSVASGSERSSDGYAVQTKAEIDAEAARVAAAQRSTASANLVNRAGAYSTPAQQAEGDDYPFWAETPDDFGGGLSPFRYYYRECVDFVAWRLNRDAGVTSAPWRWDWSNLASGSAYAWADEWVRRGRATSSTPIVGSVAWFPYNHVAYVQAVNADGTVTIEEYNQNSDHSYHVRTIPASSALYLYPPA